MIGTIASKLALYALKFNLTVKARNELTRAILASVGALPIKDVLQFNQDGSLLVKGEPVDVLSAHALKESAKLVLGSKAHVLIDEQVAFMAVTLGVHNCDSLDKMQFARGALWHGQQKDRLLRLLAQDGQESE